jgi:hypothetical protein
MRLPNRVESSSMAGIKAVALTLGLLACGALGLLAALVWQPESGVKEAAVLRIHNGVTERGRIVVVTTAGHTRRAIVWRTQSGVETQTVEGPLRVGSMIRSSTSDAPLARQSLRTLAVTLPARTVSVPAATVIQTVTQTVPQDTVTETLGTTEVVTITETVPESGSP